MIKMIKKYLFPKIDAEVQNHVNHTSLISIWRTALVIMVFEAIMLLTFILTRKEFDHSTMVSIGSASFCLISCFAGASCAGWMRKRKQLPRHMVATFNSVYYLLLSSWGIMVSYRNYNNNEQMLTFFAVQIMMVCFVLLRPILSIAFASLIYISMYIVFYNIDGAKGINIFNYTLLLIVNITGMIVRYYAEINASRSAVELINTNDRLFYNNRHDGLTGLRNRKALEEDVQKVVNNHVTVYMIDINYFKDINDNYGHAVGDRVLFETAHWIRSLFKADRCYRYGGDEFLVLSMDEGTYEEDTFTFSVPEIPDKSILLSIGSADGTPADHDELFKLISQADCVLYEIKKRTHSPEYGGHGNRQG